MSDYKWMFGVGDVVSRVTDSPSESAMVVVLARVTEERSDHTRRYYLCGGQVFGNSSFEEAELRLIARADEARKYSPSPA